MGEAKRRQDELGLTRKIRFMRHELMDIIAFLVPQYGPDDPRATVPQKKINRDARRPLRQALDQLKVLDIWHRARKGPVQSAEIPDTRVCELTVEAINTLLSLFNVDMDYRDMLNIGEIEDRLEDAKAGIYVMPEEPAPPAPPASAAADVPTEATEAPADPPALVSVPAPATE